MEKKNGLLTCTHLYQKMPSISRWPWHSHSPDRPPLDPGLQGGTKACMAKLQVHSNYSLAHRLHSPAFYHTVYKSFYTRGYSNYMSMYIHIHMYMYMRVWLLEPHIMYMYILQMHSNSHDSNQTQPTGQQLQLHQHSPQNVFMVVTSVQVQRRG